MSMPVSCVVLIVCFCLFFFVFCFHVPPFLTMIDGKTVVKFGSVMNLTAKRSRTAIRMDGVALHVQNAKLVFFFFFFYCDTIYFLKIFLTFIFFSAICTSA